jgi:hypothetical protein
LSPIDIDTISSHLYPHYISPAIPPSFTNKITLTIYPKTLEKKSHTFFFANASSFFIPTVNRHRERERISIERND